MGDTKAERILIVDDEPYITELISRWLGSIGYQCSTAASGEEALTLLETRTFDLMITDILMSGMSGIDLLSIVKSIYPNMAVVVVTAVDDWETGKVAVEFKVDGYLIKPLRENELRINVARVLTGRLDGLPDGAKKVSAAGRVERLNGTTRKVMISIPEFVRAVRSGVDDRVLMERFRCSAESLQEVFRKLLSASKLTQADLDGREGVSDGTVIIDSSELEFPSFAGNKPTIRASDAVRCLQSGMDDAEIMKRYQISARALQSLFAKLVKLELIDKSEIERRLRQSRQWVVFEEQ